MANVYLATHNLKKSQKYFEKILEVNPEAPIALEGIGIIEFYNTNYAKAFNYFKKAEESKNSFQLSYESLICLGHIYLKDNNVVVAGQVFTKAIERSKDNASAHAGLGYCLTTRNNFIFMNSLILETHKHFEIALKSEPKNAIYLTYIGVTDYLLGNYKTAIKELESAIKNGATNKEIYNSLAMAYTKANDFEQARINIEIARDLAPADARFFINSGVIEALYADYILRKAPKTNVDSIVSKMNNFYKEALKLNVDTSIILINKGYGYVMANKRDSALIIYDQIVRADSLVLAGKNNNKGVVFALNDSQKEAGNLFDKADALDNNNRYSFINDNIYKLEDKRSFRLFSRDRKYTSLVYYYMPLSTCTPKIGSDFNVPVVAVEGGIPEEKVEAFTFDYSCTQHFTYKLKVSESKSGSHCKIRPIQVCQN